MPISPEKTGRYCRVDDEYYITKCAPYGWKFHVYFKDARWDILDNWHTGWRWTKKGAARACLRWRAHYLRGEDRPVGIKPEDVLYGDATKRATKNLKKIAHDLER